MTPSPSEAPLSPERPVTADLISTASAAQTAEEIEALGDLDSYGLLRDGTLLTVWADTRGYDGQGDLVRRAFRLRSAAGKETVGRLPEGEMDAYSAQPVVVPTEHGFVVSGQPAVLVAPDGTVRPFRPHPGQEIEDGDVIAPAGAGHVRLLRPGSATDHVLSLGIDVVPLATAEGTLYGFLNPQTSFGLPDPVQVGSWSGSGDWSSHVVGDLFDLEVVAHGDHAAAWVCDEGGHGYGGDGRVCGSEGFAVTGDGGNTWRDLAPGERPFDQIDQAVAANGHLFVKSWPKGFWRSTDPSWTSFAPVRLPSRATLHAEDGFVSASVQIRGRFTVQRLADDGETDETITIDAPRDSKPIGRGPRAATPIGSGDGSLLLVGGSRESHLVTAQGVGPSGAWPRPIGLTEGYLLLDRRDLASSTLLTATGERLATTVGDSAAVRADDVLVTTGRRVRHLWSFRPADRTFRELTPPHLRQDHDVSAVVDDRGRAWLLQDRTLWRSDDGGFQWRSLRLPQPASTTSRTSLWTLHVSGPRVLVVLDGPQTSLSRPPPQTLRLLSPDGTWSTVALPPRMPGAPDVWLLRDGRLLLGPVVGRLWRSTSTANRRFESIPAGPIAQVTPAGDLLYGVPLGPGYDDRTPLPLPADRGKVWLSRDSGTTWVEVAR
jgi:hypothetical protein